MRKRENKKKKKKKGKIHTREWCFRHRWNFYWDRNKRRNFLRNHDIFVFTEKFKGKKNIFDKINFLFLNCNQSLEMSQVHDQKKCRSRKKENFFFSPLAFIARPNDSRQRNKFFNVGFRNKIRMSVNRRCNHRKNI